MLVILDVGGDEHMYMYKLDVGGGCEAGVLSSSRPMWAALSRHVEILGLLTVYQTESTVMHATVAIQCTILDVFYARGWGCR
jgi:hypothetical protein